MALTIGAVMATRFDPPQREVLLELLRREGVKPVVMADVGPHRPGWSLYRFWNNGVRYAIDNLHADYVCVLNDDVTILPHTLYDLRRWLDLHPEIGVVYPDARKWTGMGKSDCQTMEPTTGTWGAGGMTGFCFMFRADLGVWFDEDYQLWYGDDAFEEAVRAKGLLVARISGLPIDHSPGRSTSRLPDEEVTAMIDHDRALWEARHAA